jgi:hypothetical protein
MVSSEAPTSKRVQPREGRRRPKGRGTAVGGEGNRGAVVVGDHNQVEVFGTLERASRHFEALTLGEVPSRAALPPGSVMPLRPSRYFVGREVKG